jgi:hypothetical protein
MEGDVPVKLPLRERFYRAQHPGGSLLRGGGRPAADQYFASPAAIHELPGRQWSAGNNQLAADFESVSARGGAILPKQPTAGVYP